jgi:hypothetical protein
LNALGEVSPPVHAGGPTTHTKALGTIALAARLFGAPSQTGSPPTAGGKLASGELAAPFRGRLIFKMQDHSAIAPVLIGTAPSTLANATNYLT